MNIALIIVGFILLLILLVWIWKKIFKNSDSLTNIILVDAATDVVSDIVSSID